MLCIAMLWSAPIHCIFSDKCSTSNKCLPLIKQCKKPCSQKISKIYRKTAKLEYVLNKAAGLKDCNFIKKRLQHMFFLVKFEKFLRTRILKNICERLLLKFCYCLKSDSHLPRNCFICFNKSPLKITKNVFYFILKALFVLKIF